MIKTIKQYSHLFSIVFLLALSACSSTKNTQTGNTAPVKGSQTQKAISGKSEGKIDSAEIERLYIDGCKYLAL